MPTWVARASGTQVTTSSLRSKSSVGRGSAGFNKTRCWNRRQDRKGRRGSQPLVIAAATANADVDWKTLLQDALQPMKPTRPPTATQAAPSPAVQPSASEPQLQPSQPEVGDRSPFTTTQPSVDSAATQSASSSAADPLSQLARNGPAQSSGSTANSLQDTITSSTPSAQTQSPWDRAREEFGALRNFAKPATDSIAPDAPAKGSGSSSSRLTDTVQSQPSAVAVPEQSPSVPQGGTDALPEVSPLSAASDAADAAASAPAGLSSLTDSASNAVESAQASASQALTGITDSASEAVTSVRDSVAEAVSGITDTANGAFSGLTSTASDTLSGLADSASEKLSSVSGVATGAVDSVRDTATGAAQAALDAASNLTSSLNQATNGALDGVTSSVQGVLEEAADNTAGARQSLSASVDAVSRQLSTVMSSLVDSLPPEAQAALAAGADVAAKILAQATSSPAALAASSGVAIGVPVVLWWRARYGGYAGKLQPVDVFTMLQNEDAVLVDIRTDEQRFQDGVVELKRAARDRGAVIPISRLEAALARQLRRADEVAFDIAAAQIAGLRQVTSRTKIIIMGEGEERAVKVARALRTVASRSAYVMQGGFSAWYREQLPLKYGAVDYSSSAGDYLADEAEVIAEKTTSLLSRLRDPPTAVLTAAALTLSGYTIYDIHSTLRFVGVAGMLLTLANRASRYDSPQDALDDLQGAYARVAGLLPGTRTRRPAVQPMMLDADDNAEDFGEEAEPQPVSSSSSPPSQKPVSNGV